MARGNRISKRTAVGGTEILNRARFEGISMTIDFSSVDDVDKDTGKKIVKAGTPISGKGVPVDASPWEGAAGILMQDVYEDMPDGTILKKAYINKTVAQASSGLVYDEALGNLLPMIVFEEDTGK